MGCSLRLASKQANHIVASVFVSFGAQNAKTNDMLATTSTSSSISTSVPACVLSWMWWWWWWAHRSSTQAAHRHAFHSGVLSEESLREQGTLIVAILMNDGFRAQVVRLENEIEREREREREREKMSH